MKTENLEYHKKELHDVTEQIKHNYTVCISNISYYVSDYCGLMPDDVVRIKSRIEEIKEQLKELEDLE